MVLTMCLEQTMKDATKTVFDHQPHLTVEHHSPLVGVYDSAVRSVETTLDYLQDLLHLSRS